MRFHRASLYVADRGFRYLPTDWIALNLYMLTDKLDECQVHVAYGKRVSQCETKKG